MRHHEDDSAAGEAVTRASAGVWRLFVERIPGAWMVEEHTAAAVVTGLCSPTENGVLALARDASGPTIETLLDRVAATDLPHHLLLRPDMDDDVLDIPRRRGMELEAEEPAMILRDFSSLPRAARAAGLTVRMLRPDRIDDHVEVVQEVFGSPPDVVNALMNPAVMSRPGVKCYAGYAGGETVCTGVGVTHDGATAIFSVATKAAHRARGYGTAITARAALDGAAAGARWAWLQSSGSGRRVYERLGFASVETQALWVTD